MILMNGAEMCKAVVWGWCTREVERRKVRLLRGVRVRENFLSFASTRSKVS